MKKILAITFSLVLMFSLVACGENSNSEQEQNKSNVESQESSQDNKEGESNIEKDNDEDSNVKADYYPVTVNTGGEDVVIEKMPENVAVFNYDIAEMMSALGLADKIKIFRGGHQSLDAILPEYRDALTGIKDTDEISGDKGFPPLEVMINLDPDIIIMPSYYFNVPVFGSKDDYKNNDIKIYMTEGTYVPDCTIENTYSDIMNIGKIFNKEEKAQEIVADMKERVKAVEEKMKGKKKIKVLAYDIEMEGKVVTWGGKGLANNLLKIAGGENVFANTDKQFPHVSFEEIVDSDPDLIIIDVYGDDKSNGQDTIKKLKENPLTADLRAVKENKFLTIPLFSIFPSIQNVNMLETVSDEILKLQ